MKDKVDEIMQEYKTKGDKFLGLYAVMQLNYRQPLGDKAWGAIGEILGDESLLSAFAFLSGYLIALDFKEGNFKEKFEQLLNPVNPR